MTIGELKKAIADIPDDTEVLIKNHVNPVGNVWELPRLEKSTYSFFGNDLPCVLFVPSVNDEEE